MHKVPAKRIGDALAPRGIVDHEGIAVASGVISGGRGAPEASALTIRSIAASESLSRSRLISNRIAEALTRHTCGGQHVAFWL